MPFAVQQVSRKLGLAQWSVKRMGHTGSALTTVVWTSWQRQTPFSFPVLMASMTSWKSQDIFPHTRSSQWLLADSCRPWVEREDGICDPVRIIRIQSHAVWTDECLCCLPKTRASREWCWLCVSLLGNIFVLSCTLEEHPPLNIHPSHAWAGLTDLQIQAEVKSNVSVEDAGSKVVKNFGCLTNAPPVFQRVWRMPLLSSKDSCIQRVVLTLCQSTWEYTCVLLYTGGTSISFKRKRGWQISGYEQKLKATSQWRLQVTRWWTPPYSRVYSWFLHQKTGASCVFCNWWSRKHRFQRS